MNNNDTQYAEYFASLEELKIKANAEEKMKIVTTHTLGCMRHDYTRHGAYLTGNTRDGIIAHIPLGG